MTAAPYSDYKDCGISWLGLLPSHWRLKQLKHVAAAIPSNVDKHSKDGETSVSLCNYTDVYYRDRITDDIDFMPATASRREIERFRLLADDVVVTKDSETANDIGVPSYVPDALPGVICGYHLSIIRPAVDSIGRFLKYVLLSDPTRYYSEISAKGLTRVGLSQGALGNTPVPTPPRHEQKAIADFLDHETARIDALIEEQQRLIYLLQEKRNASVSAAVTSGLDRSAPVRESGVEWIRRIPEHWRVERIGMLLPDSYETGRADLPVLSVSLHHGVSNSEFSEEEADRKLTRIADREKYKRVRPGDLVYNMMRAWQGAFGAVSVNGLVSPAYVVARPKVSVTTGFLEQQLRSPTAIEEMRRFFYGITDFRLRLYWDSFKDIRVALPPEYEQQRIMEEIERIVSETTTLTNDARRNIALLKERRSALISAAVTGKIDVRDWNTQHTAEMGELSRVAEPEQPYG